MSTQVIVRFKDKDRQPRVFDGQRAGGSWTNRVEFRDGFAIVVDVDGNTHAYPAADILDVETQGGRR